MPRTKGIELPFEARTLMVSKTGVPFILVADGTHPETGTSIFKMHFLKRICGKWSMPGILSNGRYTSNELRKAGCIVK